MFFQQCLCQMCSAADACDIHTLLGSSVELNTAHTLFICGVKSRCRKLSVWRHKKEKMLEVYDRYDSRLNFAFQITVDTWGVVPQSTYTYLISLTVDIDWLIHSQVSTGERGGCCWNRSGSHNGSCCQSDYRLLHHWRQRGRWVLSVLFWPSKVGLLIPVTTMCCRACLS